MTDEFKFEKQISTTGENQNDSNLKIKEQVIERLALILFHENKIDGQDIDAQTLKYWQLQVQTVLEALPIEFVSRDSEAKEGDLLEFKDFGQKVWQYDIADKDSEGALLVTYYAEDTGAYSAPYGSFTPENVDAKYKNRIIQRNNKPVIYIEDIKDDR